MAITKRRCHQPRQAGEEMKRVIKRLQAQPQRQPGDQTGQPQQRVKGAKAKRKPPHAARPAPAYQQPGQQLQSRYAASNGSGSYAWFQAARETPHPAREQAETAACWCLGAAGIHHWPGCTRSVRARECSRASPIPRLPHSTGVCICNRARGHSRSGAISAPECQNGQPPDMPVVAPSQANHSAIASAGPFKEDR